MEGDEADLAVGWNVDYWYLSFLDCILSLETFIFLLGREIWVPGEPVIHCFIDVWQRPGWVECGTSTSLEQEFVLLVNIRYPILAL